MIQKDLNGMETDESERCELTKSSGALGLKSHAEVLENVWEPLQGQEFVCKVHCRKVRELYLRR